MRFSRGPSTRFIERLRSRFDTGRIPGGPLRRRPTGEPGERTAQRLAVKLDIQTRPDGAIAEPLAVRVPARRLTAQRCLGATLWEAVAFDWIDQVLG
jgi:hypothetical protein